MNDNTTGNTSSRFILIGIRILEGCDPSIRKVLKEGVTYFFVDGYEDDGKGFVRLSRDEKNALEALYDIKGRTEDNKERDIHVNISAIVGKNGCGKSTLLEVMLRVLNNFAKACKFDEKHKTLRQVNKPINACLYYLYNGNIFTIKSEGDKIEYYENGGSALSLPNANDSEAFKNLFYSIVVNYSLYAYNDNMFVDETKYEDTGEYQEKSWIAALYHKNDAYQTPVNITPMRTDGNIDINEENRLSRQRLMALYTYAGEKPESRIINESTIDKYKGITDDNEIAIGFACKLEDESKLWKKSIDEYFINNATSYVPGFGMIDSLMSSLNPETIYETAHSSQVINNAKGLLEFIDYYLSRSKKHTELCQKINKNSSKYKFKYAQKSDLNNMLSDLKAIQSFSDGTVTLIQNNSIESYDDFKWMNISQMFRLCTIWIIWEKLIALDKIDKKADLSSDLKNSENDSIPAARLYLVYKTIHIIETYYKNTINISDVTGTTIGTFPTIKSKLENTIEKIINTNDYTTLKLTQTINYLKHDQLHYTNYIYEHNPNYNHGKFLGFAKFVDFKKLKGNIYIANNKGGNEEMQLQEITKFLPPPILVGDIVIQHKGEYYGLSSLSSGETQRLFTISSILYHLRNLDFEQTDKDKIQYKNVSLIFDETEQYFHPEFQRTFVYYLLKQLNNASFEQIENINILLVTHSPFMLSDILDRRILYLEEGRSKKIDLVTFASNINDLLRHSFFLEYGFMGKFATEKIRSIIDKIESEIKIDDIEDGQIVELIQNIGEPIIKEQLMMMYLEKRFGYSSSNKKRWLQQLMEKI